MMKTWHVTNVGRNHIEVSLNVVPTTHSMPVLPCPLGSRCSEGDEGGTWKSVDLDYEQARQLVADHVKYAHPSVSENLNVNLNKGTEGGNFVNSSLQYPTFNIHNPAPPTPPPPLHTSTLHLHHSDSDNKNQQESFDAVSVFLQLLSQSPYVRAIVSIIVIIVIIFFYSFFCFVFVSSL